MKASKDVCYRTGKRIKRRFFREEPTGNWEQYDNKHMDNYKSEATVEDGCCRGSQK
jgi:hypothetical protein